MDLEYIKNHIIEYEGYDTWEEFINNQELGECQYICSDLNKFGLRRVFGEIELDDGYIDSNGNPQILATHHWLLDGDRILDFSKGTLKDYINWDDLYAIEVDGDEWRYNTITIKENINNNMFDDWKTELAAIVESVLKPEVEVVEEGSHGDTAAVKDMLKKGVKMGLVRVETKGKGYMVKSLIDDSQLLIHRGESGLHELRRYLQKLQKSAVAA
jgi:hypothetical protein